ncbi:ABC transporter substrate-binding protein [Ktedonosporobacter rubrisoli]|uniref:ABC transporter substrate-binding protein n=1 Tax=Ktedonosporobacter rubrisoli TaxID=2509675 RepID=A0A4P6K4G7_KTERU|nr:ABC transporter substrate-binding protein [Ktedonosporobacter rubrisoli]QBD82823.1 ABC transporter substrate-binding protein [Ktedonosporobacter rubrisoli]
MNIRRSILIAGIVTLVLLVVIGAFLWQRSHLPEGSTSPGNAKALTKLRLALDFTPNPNHTGIYVALQKGWYQQAGIDLEILPFSPNAFPDVLVTTGKADIAISSTESVVLDDAQGQKIISIAGITAHNTSLLVTRADSAAKRPRDLDGKIYGGYGAPYEQPIVSAVIRHDGGKGTFKNVTLGTDAIQALASHQIDFAWVFGLDVVQAEQQGVKLKTFPVTQYGIPDYYAPTLVTSTETMQQQAALLTRFMHVTQRGYAFAQTHPQEAARLLIQAAPKGTFPSEAQVEPEQRYVSPLYADGTKWGVQRSEAWKDYTNFILQTGSVKDAAGKPVDHLESTTLYTNAFVQ